jgi:Epoxide hydrolase N terminus
MEASAQAENVAIRPYDVDIQQDALDDLRRRIAATRWPSKELVADRSQGVQLATLQALARYWTTDYDWSRCEARLNALLSWRDLRGPAQLGGGCLPRPRLLQRGRQGRPLRRLGGAGALLH